MKLKYYLLFLFINGFCYSQIDSTWSSKKNKIKIPFELTNNLIIIKIKLNAVELKMILDTGSRDNILFSVPSNDSLIVNDVTKTNIKGVGMEEPMTVIISTNNTLKIKEYTDTNFRILILDENQIDLINKIGIDINGIIGYSFFKDKIVKIDYRNKKIILCKNNSFLKKNKIKKYNKTDIELIDRKPYIKMNSSISNSMNLNLLIDTGLSDGLWLFKSDSIIVSNNFINDYLGFGLSGIILGKRARVDNVKLSDFKFKDVLVSYPDSIYHNNNLNFERNGSVGGEILKRFDIIIDYKNEIFYLKKNNLFSNDFNYNMSGLEVQHVGKNWIEEIVKLNQLDNSSVRGSKVILDDLSSQYKVKYTLKPVYKITHIRENSPASSVDLKVGDQIITINKKIAYNYTMQKITDLFQSEDGKKIKMEVERDGKIIEVIFYLKKII